MKREEDRLRIGKRAGIVGLICNLFLFAGKLTVGILFGSIAVQADAINNLSDAASGLVSLLGFKMASRPADADHPYGHARYEYLAGLIVSILILVIGVELLKTSIEKLVAPSPVEFSAVTIGVLSASIAVKLGLALYDRHMGKRIASQTLLSAAADSRNDVIATSAVLIAAVISHATSVELDGWMGIAVGLFILYSGAGLVKETLDPLLGKAPDSATVQEIHDRIMAHEGVLGTHDLMVHDYGPGRKFASAHVEVSASIDPLAAHDILDAIEREFLEEDALNMVLHCDPIVTDSEAGELRTSVAAAVREVYPELEIHDFRMVPGKRTKLIFDCVKPHSIRCSDTELKARIQARVRREHPNCDCVIKFDPGYVSAK